jgi:PTH1 family peptidyl-tRNA hydrolase
MSAHLIVGLGNPGTEYADTRHNIGFRVVEALADSGAAAWSSERLADRCEMSYRGRKLVLIKPTTYMNLSGRAVSYHLLALKAPADRLVVITDDIALPFGTLRLRAKGSAGGHNGLKDISATLGHDNYTRLRIGVGADFPAGRQVDYVLGNFSRDEAKDLPAVLAEAVACIQTIVFRGIGEAMTQHNRNVLAPPPPPKSALPPTTAPHTSAPN